MRDPASASGARSWFSCSCLLLLRPGFLRLENCEAKIYDSVVAIYLAKDSLKRNLPLGSALIGDTPFVTIANTEEVLRTQKRKVMSKRAVATKTQSPELKRLTVIVDEWSEETQAFNSASCPAAKVTAVETFEWMPDELSLLHSLDDALGKTAVEASRPTDGG